MKIAVLPGDGIGTEIVAEAVKVLKVLGLPFEMETALVGGAAFEAHGHPLPDSTLNLAKAADAILFGAVGDWKYDKLDRPLRPEQAILGLPPYPGIAPAAIRQPHAAADLDAALADLAAQTHIGFDTESKPTFTRGTTDAGTGTAKRSFST